MAIVGGVAGLSGVVLAYDWVMGRRRERRSRSVDPVRVLEIRFAEGEIDEDEFNRRVHRLRMGPPLELD